MRKAKEELIPLRLTFNVGEEVLEEVFLWNINEKQVSPRDYAFLLCKEMGLGEEYVNGAENVMLEQIEHYKKIIDNYPTFLHEMDEERKNRNEKYNPNIRVIYLDVTVEGFRFRDQFEWDINNLDNNPESFTRSLCLDLGLEREFEVSISHSLREQIFLHRFEALETKEFGPMREYESDGEIVRYESDGDVWGPQISLKSSSNVPLSKREARQIKRTGKEADNQNIVGRFPFSTLVSLSSEDSEIRKGKRRRSSNKSTPISSKKTKTRSQVSTPKEKDTPFSPSNLQPFTDN